MRYYETAFLIAPNLSEEETEKLISQMSGVVSKKKGKMINLDKWGKRKLAYSIQKFEDAFYVFLQYEGESDIPAELERRFKQTEAILRYLTVKREQKENIRKKKKKSSVAPRETPFREEKKVEKPEEIPDETEVKESEKIEEE